VDASLADRGPHAGVVVDRQQPDRLIVPLAAR